MLVDFCSFNVRGLNNKQTPVKDFISVNKLSLVALLETKVQKEKAREISRRISPRFNWEFNYDHHHLGRIWLGWDPSLWKVLVVASSSQHITCSIMKVDTNVSMLISFVYGLHTYSDRRPLWEDLDRLKNLVDTYLGVY